MVTNIQPTYAKSRRASHFGIASAVRSKRLTSARLETSSVATMAATGRYRPWGGTSALPVSSDAGTSATTSSRRCTSGIKKPALHAAAAASSHAAISDT